MHACANDLRPRAASAHQWGASRLHVASSWCRWSYGTSSRSRPRHFAGRQRPHTCGGFHDRSVSWMPNGTNWTTNWKAPRARMGWHPYLSRGSAASRSGRRHGWQGGHSQRRHRERAKSLAIARTPHSASPRNRPDPRLEGHAVTTSDGQVFWARGGNRGPVSYIGRSCWPPRMRSCFGRRHWSWRRWRFASANLQLSRESGNGAKPPQA